MYSRQKQWRNWITRGLVHSAQGNSTYAVHRHVSPRCTGQILLIQVPDRYYHPFKVFKTSTSGKENESSRSYNSGQVAQRSLDETADHCQRTGHACLEVSPWKENCWDEHSARSSHASLSDLNSQPGAGEWTPEHWGSDASLSPQLERGASSGWNMARVFMLKRVLTEELRSARV